MTNKWRMQTSISEKIITIIVYVVIILLCIVTIYPFIYVFCYSISEAGKASAFPITVYPRGFTLTNYQAVLKDSDIFNAFFISVTRTLIGTTGTLLVTGLTAYALSKRLIAKKWIMWYFMIPMYVSAGLIPTFVIISKLGLLNNYLVYIFPLLFSTYYMIIMKTFFEQLPPSLEESALIDGANHFTVFIRIVIPSSMPVIATIALFAGVQQWNSYFDGILYISIKSLQPMQTLMYRILKGEEVFTLSEMMTIENNTSIVTMEGIKMAMLMVTTVPILCVYPFLQKFFVKGMLLGAVKG